VTDDPRTEYVQPQRRIDAPIVLVEPDPSWPEQYAVQAARIRAALGARALQVEHVGSTSIPGLMAKPVLDIVLAVADPADEAAYVSDLETAGYLLHLREPDWHEHRLLRGMDPAVNLHVFPLGNVETRRMLLFRDWLRSHPDDLALYQRTKRELGARTWAVVQDYADAKTEVVAAIVGRAEAAEAAATRRRGGP
jgi:GrpB-like predicted nucleotidyltransferase (UPF0157 family)